MILALKNNDKNKTENEEVIKIGVVLPLTGPVASYGEVVKNSLELSKENLVNSGKLGNKKLELIYEDGKCAGKDALSAAQKLVNIDKVKFIIGGTCSGETIAIAPFTEKEKVLIFSPTPSNLAISELGDYVFRLMAKDTEFVKPIIQDIKNKNYKNIAIISENIEGAKAYLNVILKDLPKENIVFNELFNTDEIDFKSLVLKLKNANPDVIILNPIGGINGAKLAKDIRLLNINSQIYLSSNYGDEYIKSGKFVEGTLIPDLQDYTKSTDENVKSFVSEYNNKYGNTNNILMAVFSSDTFNLLIEKILKNGLDTTKVKDALYKVKDYKGVSGTFSIDSKGDANGFQFIMKQIKNGELIEVK